MFSLVGRCCRGIRTLAKIKEKIVLIASLTSQQYFSKGFGGDEHHLSPLNLQQQCDVAVCLIISFIFSIIWGDFIFNTLSCFNPVVIYFLRENLYPIVKNKSII
jgi:hypothetical protein